MADLHYQGAIIRLQHNESVLDGLLREGHAIASGCRAGVCQSCVMVSDSADMPATARRGLSDAQLALNHFLACQCVPSTSLQIRAAAGAGLRIRAEVVDRLLLAPDVLGLRLACKLSYRAGQYVTLWKNAHVARSYSLASHPALDDYLEFHIRVLPDGQFSQWALQHLHSGAELDIQGPMGRCFYAARPDQPLVLAATGTGLAPIYGIVRDALYLGHQGTIDVVVAARRAGQFYLRDELQALATQHANLRCHWLVQHGDDEAEATDVYAWCGQRFTNLQDCKIHLCGSDSFVRRLRRQFFLAGAAMANIAADVFLPCG